MVKDRLDVHLQRSWRAGSRRVLLERWLTGTPHCGYPIVHLDDLDGAEA